MGDMVKVELKQAYGLTVIAKASSNHWVVIDGPENFNGHDAGPKTNGTSLNGACRLHRAGCHFNSR